MSAPRCPRCHVEVGTTWRWCLACGYDPDGSADRVRQAAIEARRRDGGWLPVIIVIAGLAVGALILWRTTPDDSAETVSPSTAAEITAWVPFEPPGSGIRVELPQRPVAPTSSPMPDASGKPTDSYLVVGGNHLFGVTVVDGPGGAQPVTGEERTRAALRTHVDRVASALTASVESTEPTTVGTTPALDFEITGGVFGHVRGRTVLVGTRLTTVTVSSGEMNDALAEHVLGSISVM